LIKGLAYGNPEVVNHLNWLRSDDTSANLEVTDQATNLAHRCLSDAPPRNNKSGARNVYLGKDGFYRVTVGGKHIAFTKDFDVACSRAAAARAAYNAAKLISGYRRAAAVQAKSQQVAA
jgi:hypothetical protein